MCPRRRRPRQRDGRRLAPPSRVSMVRPTSARALEAARERGTGRRGWQRTHRRDPGRGRTPDTGVFRSVHVLRLTKGPSFACLGRPTHRGRRAMPKEIFDQARKGRGARWREGSTKRSRAATSGHRSAASAAQRTAFNPWPSSSASIAGSAAAVRAQEPPRCSSPRRGRHHVAVAAPPSRVGRSTLPSPAEPSPFPIASIGPAASPAAAPRAIAGALKIP